MSVTVTGQKRRSVKNGGKVKTESDYEESEVIMKKDFTIEIKFSHAENIARYYQVPLAVFLGGKLPKGTRKQNYLARIKKAVVRIKKISDKL